LREPREGQERERHYLVLSRSCADLYEEVARLFADESRIEVVVDRRRGLDGMTEIPAARKRRAERRRRRRQASMTLMLPEPAKEVQAGRGRLPEVSRLRLR
jgi:hypothetical protein